MIHSTQNTTLHLLLASISKQPQILKRILDVWANGDQLLLLNKSAQAVTTQAVIDFAQLIQQQGSERMPYLFILDVDAILLSLPESLPPYLKIISTDEWSALLLKHQRALTWAN